MGGNGHDLLLATVGIVSPAEGDAIVFKGHEAMVRDGDAMGVAGQVVENVFSAAEWRLGVDDPILPEQLAKEVAEAAWRGQMPLRAVDLKLVLREELLQSSDELAAENAAQCVNRQEKATGRGNPSGAIRC